VGCGNDEIDLKKIHCLSGHFESIGFCCVESHLTRVLVTIVGDRPVLKATVQMSHDALNDREQMWRLKNPARYPHLVSTAKRLWLASRKGEVL
jgi:hypothetical protein